jgi:hypothetical protein
MKIADRAIATLIQAQGLSDLYQLYVIAQRDGIDYNVACIPQSFTERLDAPFDQTYMRNLFAVGRDTMLNGTAWSGVPPGFNAIPVPSALPAARRGRTGAS